MATVNLEKVTKVYPNGKPAVLDLDLDVAEGELMVLLRAALLNISPHDSAELMAAWSFAWALKREEVIAALEHRSEQIAASARASEYAIDDIFSSPGTRSAGGCCASWDVAGWASSTWPDSGAWVGSWR